MVSDMTQGNATVLIVNDRLEYNSLYRTALMKNVQDNGYLVKSVTPFRNGRLSLRRLLAIFLDYKSLCISSNLRSNIVTLCQPWRIGMVIFNGLGRYRQNSYARSLLLKLVSINSRKAISVQSYADFRFFRRFTRHKNLHWVPGSGGLAKPVGTEANALVVQRDDKIRLVAPDLLKLLGSLDFTLKLKVVGCRDASLVDQAFPGKNVENIGFISSEKILLSGNLFLQPCGYGEGFPHSLADAISSGMRIYIARSEYIRYGLWKIGANYLTRAPAWGELVYESHLQDAISNKVVTQRYFDIFAAMIKRKLHN